jgi:carbonic anhydrase
MKKLLSGLRQFQQNYVPSHQALMKELAKGQHPRVLFISCSDSRVDPTIITQAEIGDLFVIRNAGNIVPPYEATNGGEGATIEYAIAALDIRQIIVCGHTQCGAMKGLLQLGELEDKMPLVYEWLRHTEATRRLVNENYGHLEKKEMLDALVAENVLTQIENLRTYPVIRSKLYRGELSIHAWIYNITNGEILAYDAETHAYVPPHSKLYADDIEHGIVGHAPLVVSTNGNGKSTFNEPPQPHWPGVNRLNPEQAARIYRGA